MASLNLARTAWLVAFGSVALALAPAGCVGGWSQVNIEEGDRCNPYNSHNECGTGLACTVTSWQVANQSGTSYLGTPNIALGAAAGLDNAGAYNVLEFCPENYCCPVDSNGDLATSGNANCQPGCNGGAAAICAAGGSMDPPAYPGVCNFANGVSADAGPVPDAGDGGLPD